MKNGETRRGLLLQQKRGIGNARQTADARTDQNPGFLLRLGRIELQAGIGDRLIRGSHSVGDEIIDLALLLGLHPVIGIKLALARSARNEVGDMAGDVGDFELLNAPRAVLAGKQRPPGWLNAAAHRSNQSKSGDHDAAHSENLSPS